MHRAENQAHSECGWKPGDEGVGMDSSRSEPDKWRTKNRKERGRHCLLSKHLAARPPVQAALRLASLGLDGTRPTLQTRSLEEAMPAISCQRVRLRPAWEQKTLDRIGLLMEAATKGSGCPHPPEKTSHKPSPTFFSPPHQYFPGFPHPRSLALSRIVEP